MDQSNLPPEHSTVISQTVPQPATPVSPPPPPPSSSVSTNAIIALILGILSLTCGCGFVTGIPAFFVGRAELKAVRENRSPYSNKALAKIGMILGAIGAVISFLVIIGYLLLIALGVSLGMMQDMR